MTLFPYQYDYGVRFLTVLFLLMAIILGGAFLGAANGTLPDALVLPYGVGIAPR
jgi:hypothetical protein